MIPYMDINRDSGISAYELGPDWIKVQFKSGSIYAYSYVSAGRENVEQMKKLAKNGDGLNSFIMKYVKSKYVR